jgi:hypothetical protein
MAVSNEKCVCNTRSNCRQLRYCGIESRQGRGSQIQPARVVPANIIISTHFPQLDAKMQSRSPQKRNSPAASQHPTQHLPDMPCGGQNPQNHAE